VQQERHLTLCAVGSTLWDFAEWRAMLGLWHSVAWANVSLSPVDDLLIEMSAEMKQLMLKQRD
jgi:hypothetical protein